MSMDSLKKCVFTVERMSKDSSKGLRSMYSCIDKLLKNL